MVARRWRVTVSEGGSAGSTRHHEVDASNWVAALRDVRTLLGEDGAVPQGASCSVASDGTVTVVEPASRRRFQLATVGAELLGSATAPLPPPRAPVASARRRNAATIAYNPTRQDAATPMPTALPRATGSSGQRARELPGSARVHVSDAPTAPARAEAPASEEALRPRKDRKSSLSQTQAYAPEQVASARAAIAAAERTAALGVSEPSTPVDLSEPRVHQPRSRVQTTQAVSARAQGAPQPAASRSAPTSPPGEAAAPLAELQLLIARDEDPTLDTPLTYRERAYVMPEGMRVTEAETALRRALGDLQDALHSARRGKFVNLAVFDHSWEFAPERPPVVTLEWRDWKGDPVVDYPGRLARSQPPPQESGEDSADRLTVLFEQLQNLHTCANGVSALQLGLSLLGQAVPCEAAVGCLYDINTDELRVVAVDGRATALRGRVLPAKRGLLGRGFEMDRPLALDHPTRDPDFDHETDLLGTTSARALLVRSLHHKGVRHGALALVNRTGEDLTFTEGDINLVNYLCDRLADALTRLKRGQS